MVGEIAKSPLIGAKHHVILVGIAVGIVRESGTPVIAK